MKETKEKPNKNKRKNKSITTEKKESQRKLEKK